MILSTRRRLVAEALGTGLLLAVVIGSGIMGDRLSNGQVGLALLANSIATGAALIVLITLFAPISGAHFNPAVTLVLAMRSRDWRMAGAYGLAQSLGAVIGVWVAHLMFAEPVLQLSSTARDGGAQAISEMVATFGLILTILGAQRLRSEQVAPLVGLYIMSAYWFTGSTSFANPAVTLARALSDSFAGIAPTSVPAFIAAQALGALCAAALADWLFQEARQ